MTEYADDRYRRTEAVWGRQSDLSAHDADTPCIAGDLYTFRVTASYDVEWLLLDVDSAQQATLVAVDIDPRLGTRDLQVDAGADCGALVVRCGVSAEVPLAAIAAEGQRSGRVPEATLERARRWVRATGEPNRSLLAQDVDVEPDFARHMQRLADARQSLLASLSPVTAAVPMGGRRATGTVATWVAMLAVALGVGLGIAGSRWFSAYREAEADARWAERAAIVESPREDGRWQPSLAPDEVTRGGAEEASSVDELVPIELRFLPEGTWLDLRVELHALADGTLLWQDTMSGPWRRDSLTIEIPKRWLEVGKRYRFDVYGAEEAGASPRRIERYSFEIGPTGLAF